MVLVTHKLQGSQVAFPSRSLSWSGNLVLKRKVATLQLVERKEKHLSAKKGLRLRVGASASKFKPLRVSSFKGGTQHDDSGGRRSGTKVSKDSIKVSYLPENGKDNVAGTPKTANPPLSYAHETEESVSGSHAIHKLFKKWLLMLRTQSPNQVEGEVVCGEALTSQRSKTQDETQSSEPVEAAKPIWSYFWSLHATIKVPLFIFVPGFLAVNAFYGSQVSKELTPLWVLGPFVVALYIKLFQALCALYAFSFKQTVKIIGNLPVYYGMAYSYIAQGKLREDVRACIWQPIVDIKDADYNELSRAKLKDLVEWMKERYLDFVESIWPYYCRTIRFLKRANLI